MGSPDQQPITVTGYEIDFVAAGAHHPYGPETDIWLVYEVYSDGSTQGTQLCARSREEAETFVAWLESPLVKAWNATKPPPGWQGLMRYNRDNPDESFIGFVRTDEPPGLATRFIDVGSA